jgi:hypothetical protein
MPDRLPEAVDTLIAEIRDLNGLVRGERRWRRVLAVVVVAVTLLGAYNWWARSDENHQRCTSTNTSRLGIRQAFKTDHDALDGFLASIATTANGQRFVARLQTVHRREEQALAKALPTHGCD